MKNKGNQKHLTFEQRVDIEKGLTENKSFTEIGRIIGKNPSTISKEVRLHAHTKERPDSGYTHPPCIHRKNCKVTCLCDKMCGIHCKLCRKPSFRCTDICPASLVIYTVKGSYAEKFAKKHQIPVRYSAENIQDEKIKLQVSRIKRKDDQSFTDEIRLKWNQPEMADGYLIQKKEAGGKYTTCFNIKNSDICTTTISLLTISSYYGKDISFRIRAYSTGVDGKKSYTPYSYAEVSFWPKQPEITSLTKKTDRKLTVRWKKTAHTDGYEVWRSENGKPFTCVKRITNGKTQNFTDTGLKKGVTYTYAIKSYRINSLKKKIYGDIFTQTKLKTIKYS